MVTVQGLGTLMLDASFQTGYPKISVITIVRNGREFIEQTIRSVLNQSYGNIEYIVIDGESTDGTVEIIKAYEANIAKWVSEKDAGIADAFNKGLTRATGEYILFLNSDDALANAEVLKEIAQLLPEKDYPMLIYGDCDVLERHSGKVLYRACIELSAPEIKRGKMLPHPSMFTHRSYFEKYGVFDNQFKIAMDYEWLLRGGLREVIVHIPMLVTCVRNGGISTYNQTRVVNEIILALKKNGCISTLWDEVSMRSYYFSRGFARQLLIWFGLYRVFSFVRNRPIKLVKKAYISKGGMENDNS